MSTTEKSQIRVQNETKTRSAVIPVADDMTFMEVSARSVEALELPTEMGGEPISHFLFRTDTGEAILDEERVRDVFGPEDEPDVLIAPEMKPAAKAREAGL